MTRQPPVILISQRVLTDPETGERRDALDQRWAAFAVACGFTGLAVPNSVGAACAIWDAVNPAGVILTGGGDIAALGGNAPERDETELMLLGRARPSRVPLIGICRGMQLVLAHLGARFEDVGGHVRVRHEINWGSNVHTVNSFHRYGTFECPAGAEAMARSNDGVIEAFRISAEPVMGLMWHPEREDPFNADDIALFRSMFGLT